MITNYFHCMNKNEFIAAPANQPTNKQTFEIEVETHTQTFAHSNASWLIPLQIPPKRVDDGWKTANNGRNKKRRDSVCVRVFE